jgi:cytochrome c biogenesis protein CcmG, thiol:disulfide interchange protein DsbE
MSPLIILLLVGLAALLLGSGLLYLSVRRQGWHRRVLPWVGVVGAAVPLAVAALVGYVAVTEGPTLAGPDRPTAEELAAPAESFEYRLVGDDSEHSLEQHRGQVVLLNLWATWCAPCLAEMPDLSRLQEQYGEQGLVVIKLSNELGSALRSFAEREPLAAATAYVENPSRVPQPFRRGFRVLPTTYVLDRDGIIREFYVGGRSFEFHEGKVKPLL